MPPHPSHNVSRVETPVREVDVEVLPKGHRGSGPGGQPVDPFLALLAKIMDSILTIPGTNIKVGLDPVLALLPVGGGAASAFISVFFLARSAQMGVPNHVLARMAGNIIANTVLDEIPVVGDLASVFFRSNKRNYELLEKHAGTRRQTTTKDRLFMIGLVAAVVLILICLLVGMFMVVRFVWHALFG